MFDITTEKWVDVTTKNGRISVSIEDIVEHGKEYGSVIHDNLLTECSILIFLINFFTAIYVQEEEDGEIDIPDFRNGNFSRRLYDKYIEKCKKEGVSFDLFDPINPFLQIPGTMEAVKEKYKTPFSVAKIEYQYPFGNNGTHINTETNPAFTPKDCIAALLTISRYAYQKGGSKAAGNLNGDNIATYLVKGKNLYETIVLNMLTTSRNGVFGIPFYRCMNEAVENEKFPNSKLGWLNGTMLPRTVYRLILDDDGYVRNLYFCYGIKAKNNCFPNWYDPYLLYKKIKKRRDTNSEDIVYTPVNSTECDCLYMNIPLIISNANNIRNSANVFLSAREKIGDYKTTELSFMCYKHFTNNGGVTAYTSKETISLEKWFTENDEAYFYLTDELIKSVENVKKKLYNIIRAALKEGGEKSQKSNSSDSWFHNEVNTRYKTLIKGCVDKLCDMEIDTDKKDKIKAWRDDYCNEIIESTDILYKQYANTYANNKKVFISFMKKWKALKATVNKILQTNRTGECA